MDLKKIVMCVKVCRKGKRPAERNVQLTAALSNIGQVTEIVTQFLGHSDVGYGFQDTLCDMVISISAGRLLAQG